MLRAPASLPCTGGAAAPAATRQPQARAPPADPKGPGRPGRDRAHGAVSTYRYFTLQPYGLEVAVRTGRPAFKSSNASRT